MRRSAVVTGEVRQLVSEKRLDVLLLQEPYVRKQRQSHTFYGLGTGMKVAAVRSQRPWAAVAISNPHFSLLFVSQLSTTHCVCAEVQAPGFSFYVASCYFQYSDEIERHLRHLETVLRTLRGKRLIVAVDANARSSLWGPQETDERGAKFEDLIRAYGLRVVNEAGQPPTFWTTRGSSYIDVTLASPTMTQFIGEWKVRCDWTTSDHNSVDIRLRVPKGPDGDRRLATGRFDIRRADWERFAESLADLTKSKLEDLSLDSASEVEKAAEILTGVLTDACAVSMPRKRQFRKSNPWWTQALTVLKKSVHRARRAFQKERSESFRLVKRTCYCNLLRRYSKEVERTKLASWREFVGDYGNREPWGIVYKQQAEKLKIDRVISTLRRGEFSTCTMEETARSLLDTHVLDDRENEDTPEQRLVRERARLAPDSEDAPEFEANDIASVVRKIKNNKAPGPDLIEVCVLKRALKVIPGQFLRLFNGCLRWGVFPSIWKEGSLRALLKGEDRDEKDPKSYRPICLLSVVGKLFERLLKEKLAGVLLEPGSISARQYGFMPGRSAEDAVVELRRMASASNERYAVALLFDISGAFDNVWWPLVLDSLKKRDCPRNIFEVIKSYFDDRRVKLSVGSIEVSKRATKGCPQGSVLGPTCWNLIFDELLRRLDLEVQDSYAAYADDLVVLINGNSRREIEERGRNVVGIIEDWCSSAKLQLSARKTEAILLRSGEIRRAPIGRRGGARPDRKRKANNVRTWLKNKPPTIRIGDTKIKFKDTVRYLGVHLDRNLKVESHCRYLSNKVGLLFERLKNLARAHWGLKFRTLSTIYRGVFVPTVAYAAAGWSDLCTEREVKVLRAVQRRALISVTGAYRTASWESLCVVAGVAPIDIVLKERRALYSIKKGMDAKINNVTIEARDEDAIKRVKDEAINMWQARWTSSQKGRTTFAFFSDIRKRLGTRRLLTDHWSTQALTGHGDFRARLASMKLVDDGACSCGGGEETVQHFLLECPTFEAQREALRDIVGLNRWVWPEAACACVETQEAYQTFKDFCKEVLWLKSFE